MRRGRGLDDAAHDFLREPGAGRVDDDHVGASGALQQLGQRDAVSPAKKRAFVISLRPRARDRVGDRLLDELDAPQLARARGERERDRADPAVQVVHALPALQRGVLGGHPVQQLGHLGVGLEERLGGDAQVELAEALGQLASPHTSSVSPPAVVSASERERVHSTPRGSRRAPR